MPLAGDGASACSCMSFCPGKLAHYLYRMVSLLLGQQHHYISSIALAASQEVLVEASDKASSRGMDQTLLPAPAALRRQRKRVE